MLKAREDLLGTTSSSSLIHATLDGWRRQMVEQGEQLLGTALARAARVRAAIADLPGPPRLHVAGAGRAVPGTRRSVEELFATGKSQVGLDHYQIRGWTAWHRYVSLALLARPCWPCWPADAPSPCSTTTRSSH